MTQYAIRYRPGTPLADRFPGPAQPHDSRDYVEQILRACPNAESMEIVEVGVPLAVATDVQRFHGRTVVKLPRTAHRLTDDQLVDSALAAARETRGSTFGHKVVRYDDTGLVVVDLYTD